MLEKVVDNLDAQQISMQQLAFVAVLGKVRDSAAASSVSSVTDSALLAESLKRKGCGIAGSGRLPGTASKKLERQRKLAQLAVSVRDQSDFPAMKTVTLRAIFSTLVLDRKMISSQKQYTREHYGRQIGDIERRVPGKV
ncbi:hypothetical protein ACQR3P_22935 [Rhodococcus sp. IEGM1300]